MLLSCKELIDPNYRAWCAKRFFSYTKQEIFRMAGLAREAQKPRHYFSTLLKRGLAESNA